MDFERAMQPPPQPTQENLEALEDMIKKRIADHDYDDPPLLVAPQPVQAKPQLELDDRRSTKVGFWQLRLGETIRGSECRAHSLGGGKVCPTWAARDCGSLIMPWLGSGCMRWHPQLCWGPLHESSLECRAGTCVQVAMCCLLRGYRRA